MNNDYRYQSSMRDRRRGNHSRHCRDWALSYAVSRPNSRSSVACSRRRGMSLSEPVSDLERHRKTVTVFGTDDAMARFRERFADGTASVVGAATDSVWPGQSATLREDGEVPTATSRPLAGGSDISSPPTAHPNSERTQFTPPHSPVRSSTTVYWSIPRSCGSPYWIVRGATPTRPRFHHPPLGSGFSLRKNHGREPYSPTIS